MEIFWTAGTAASLGANVLLLATLLGVARQLGMLLVRMGPTMARPEPDGLELGTQVPPFTVVDQEGKLIGAGPTKYQKRLLIFTSPRCSACQALLPSIEAFTRAYYPDPQVVLISLDNYGDAKASAIVRLTRAGVIVTVAPEVHATMRVNGTPFAILLDSDNRVVARGLVNSLEHLESLLNINEFVTRDMLHVATAEALGGKDAN